MHTILLIWKNSKFYNTPARLVVLMREICNDLIRQVFFFTLVKGPRRSGPRRSLRLKLGDTRASNTSPRGYHSTFL